VIKRLSLRQAVRVRFQACQHAVHPTTMTISTVGKQNNNDKAKLPSSRIFQVYIAPLSPSFPPGEQKSTMRRGIDTHVSMRGRTTASAFTLSGSFTDRSMLTLRMLYFIFIRIPPPRTIHRGVPQRILDSSVHLIDQLSAVQPRSP